MKIKLPLSGGEYMFITGFIYFCTSMYAIFVDRFVEPDYIQMAWILTLMIPVLLPVNKLVRHAPFWRVK